ncbi:MAG TPA: flippase [Candidatus Dormibacteraeota bacterium]
MSAEAPPATGTTTTLRIGSLAVRNSLLVLAARVVSRLVALFTVVILANHLGDARYGRYVTMVAYSALVSVLADLGLSTLYTREAARTPERLTQFLGNLLAGKALLGLAAFAVLGIALALAGVGDLALPGGVLLVATSYSSLIRNTFYATGRLELEAIAILGEIAIQAAGIVAGARTGQDVSYFVWVYAASAIGTATYAAVAIRGFRLAAIRPQVDLALLRAWLRLAFPFALGFLLTNLYFRADVPILQHYRPFREVGWYQFAYKPFEALQFVPLAFQTVVYPVLAVYFRQSTGQLQLAYERFFRALVLLGWPLTVGTFVLVHPIGRLFRLFPQSEPSLRILAVAIVFLFANSAFTAMLYAIDRQDLFAWTTAIAVVINVGLNLALIPLYGYLAASATTVVTEAAFSALACWFVARRFPLPWLRLSWRTLLAGGLMGAALLPLAGRSIFISAPAGLVVYVVAAYLLRAVRRDDVSLLLRGLRAR